MLLIQDTVEFTFSLFAFSFNFPIHNYLILPFQVYKAIAMPKVKLYKSTYISDGFSHSHPFPA